MPTTVRPTTRRQRRTPGSAARTSSLRIGARSGQAAAPGIARSRVPASGDAGREGVLFGARAPAYASATESSMARPYRATGGESAGVAPPDLQTVAKKRAGAPSVPAIL